MSPKWWVLASVACGTFMATLDSSIVNIALPTLTKELGTDLYQVKWVVIVYLFVVTCLLLPFGRLSDQMGRKPIFQIGFLIFIIGSGFCSLAPDLGWLVLFRALQAIGAAMLMANGPAIITSAFTSRERGAALGILAMVVSTGLVAGPSFGGFLISQVGWRSIFWMNVPIGLFGIFLVHQFVKPDSPARPARPFDWAGAILQMLFLMLFMVVFDPPQISVSGSIPLSISHGMILSLIILIGVLFIKVEREAAAPLFDVSLLKNRTFWTANLASFLMFVSFSTITVLMPFFLEEIKHLPPQSAGFFMTAIPLTIFVIAPISGRLSDRLGSRELSSAGAFIGALGLFTMSGIFGTGIHQYTEPVKIILGLCSIGLATGLFQSPNNSAIMGTVPIHKLGVASAMLATVRNLGLVTGTGLATSLFAWRMKSTGEYIHSFHIALSVAGWIALGAMAVSLAKRRGPHGVTKPE